jgi:putative hemolysin
LQEIGRLRAITFAAAGEGSGRAVDLDRFDDHYLHLFAWDRARRQIAGAYRIGLTDQILASHGVAGLYTSTLFHYNEALVRDLPPALELGRAFVTRAYQKRSNVLMLLWKGIAALITRAPHYRVLFGPVSISSRYGSMSQELLRAFLVAHHQSPWSGRVAPVAPPRRITLPRAVDGRVSRSLDDVDRMVAALEADGKGVPVLLRQYLRLNAKVLGFNVDAAFGDALDALMLVDLADVDPAILRRYFGARQSEVSNARSEARWPRTSVQSRDTELAGTPAA